jgi:hypothetical protein
MLAFFEQEFYLPENCQFTEFVTLHFNSFAFNKKAKNHSLLTCRLFALNLNDVFLLK